MTHPSKDFLQNLAAQKEHEQESRNLRIYESSETLLGVDYGEKHTGLAIYEKGVILPLEILDSRFLILDSLVNACQERKINRVVWGWPLGIHGEENHICEQIRKLAEKLKKKTGLPYELINERYSTQMTSTPAIRHTETLTRKDDLAAMRILEFYLDSL